VLIYRYEYHWYGTKRSRSKRRVLGNACTTGVSITGKIVHGRASLTRRKQLAGIVHHENLSARDPSTNVPPPHHHRRVRNTDKRASVGPRPYGVNARVATIISRPSDRVGKIESPRDNSRRALSPSATWPKPIDFSTATESNSDRVGKRVTHIISSPSRFSANTPLWRDARTTYTGHYVGTAYTSFRRTRRTYRLYTRAP